MVIRIVAPFFGGKFRTFWSTIGYFQTNIAVTLAQNDGKVENADVGMPAVRHSRAGALSRSRWSCHMSVASRQATIPTRPSPYNDNSRLESMVTEEKVLGKETVTFFGITQNIAKSCK